MDDKDDDKDEEDLDQKSMSAPSHSLGSPPAAGTTAISPAMSSMSSNKKRKFNEGMSNNDDNDDNDVETMYPHLSRALGGENDGFIMTNPSVLKQTRLNCNDSSFQVLGAFGNLSFGKFRCFHESEFSCWKSCSGKIIGFDLWNQ